MEGWQIFAAIVLAVLMPVVGALLVYQSALWLSYNASDVILLLKGLMFVFAIALAVIFTVVFCGSFAKRHDRIPGKGRGRLDRAE